MLQFTPPSPPAVHHHYASRRLSSTAQSPRFSPQIAPAASTASTASTATRPAVPIPVPIPQSPHGTRRGGYTDAATQYSPTGFPPTYRPPPPPESAITIAPAALQEPAAAPTPAPAPAPTTATDADGPAFTVPPEPGLRVVPFQANPTSPQCAPPVMAAPSEAAASPGGQKEQAPADASASASAAPDESLESPTKRARPQEPGVKIMPLLYETCDVKDLGILISGMLMELVCLNDSIPLRDGQLTRFHSRAPPGISVRDYLNRLIVHATLSPPILLSMVFYVDKLCTMYPAFTISSLTVHRFLITAATVAAKGLSDSFWTNSQYARVGGVSLRELALLELEFLRRLDWRIVPKPETLVDYYKGLVERGEGYEMEREDTLMASPTLTPDQDSVTSDKKEPINMP